MEKIYESTELAYAKVNLGLQVCGRRADGYHLLRTVMQTISIADRMTLSCWRGMMDGSVPPIRLRVTDAASSTVIPLDQKNTVYRAVQRFMDMTGIRDVTVDIEIEKNIPSEAGLGGASTDAALALRMLDRVFPNLITEEQYMDIAAGIGADVPFFLRGGTCLCEGIGEILTELPSFSFLPVLLVKPPVGIPTPWAFKRFDEMADGGTSSESGERAAQRSRKEILSVFDGRIESLREHRTSLRNDLELVAREAHPIIGEICDFMETNGAVYASMSGSGSCVFGMFADENQRDMAKKKAEEIYPSAFYIESCCFVEAELNRRDRPS